MELHYFWGDVWSAGHSQGIVTKKLQLCYEEAYLPHLVQIPSHSGLKVH